MYYHTVLQHRIHLCRQEISCPQCPTIRKLLHCLWPLLSACRFAITHMTPPSHCLIQLVLYILLAVITLLANCTCRQARARVHPSAARVGLPKGNSSKTDQAASPPRLLPPLRLLLPLTARAAARVGAKSLQPQGFPLPPLHAGCSGPRHNTQMWCLT